MRCIAYVAMEGEGFNPEIIFQPGMPQLRQGDFVARKKLGASGRASGAQNYFWKSKEIFGEKSSIEINLFKLLNTLSNDIALVRELVSNIKVHCVIVVYREKNEEISGFYFPCDLMVKMAGLGCDLDVDIVEEVAA